MRITLAVAAACIALGWVASKLHTVASKKWIPIKDHDNTVAEIARSARVSKDERAWLVN